MVARILVPLLLVGLLACGCGSVSHAESDRAAQTLVTAISYPRQSDAAGWARAAQSTAGADAGEVVVLAADDLPAADPDDPSARLVFAIHVDATNDTFGSHPEVDTCYRASFNRYGVIGGAQRVSCPAHARSLQLPPAPPSPAIPAGFDRTVAAVLRHAGPVPDADTVRRSVLSRLRSPAPDVDVRVVGADVAIAIRTDDACQLGSRIGGRVRVYDPPRVTVQPGEMACDAVTAMGPTLEAPH